MRNLFLKWITSLLLFLPVQAVSQDLVLEAFQKRDFAKGRLLSEAVWRQAKGRAETREAGIAAANVGACLSMLGHFDDAKIWQSRAQSLLLTSGDKTLLGRLAVGRGVTDFLRGRQYGIGHVDVALDYLNQAKEILGNQEVRVQMVEAEILGQSGQATFMASALVTYAKLQRVFENRGDSLWGARCGVRWARVHGDLGQHGQALQGFVRSAGIFEATEQWRETALALRNAGHAQRKLGDYVASEVHLKRALVFARKSEDAAIVLRVLDDLVRLLSETHHYEAAIAFDLEADVLMEKIVQAVPQGYAADSVSLSLQHLLLLRFASVLPYEVDLFNGFYDMLLIQSDQD